ncbi:MAG TPA: VOC family protein [Allosphingosinicella sp.]|nr:VOC family protein [Allosphingosinicella sp.]
MADRFIWYELMTTDQDAAVDYYRKVIGWSAADHDNPEMGDFRYVIVSAGERGVGGIMQLTDEMCAGGARPGWVGYIAVADANAKAEEVAAAGGRILMGPDDIPNVGRFAMLADPGGAPFYVLTPLPRDDASPEADPQSPGLVSWHELYSSLGDRAAFDFYAGRFGWVTIEEMDMGPMGTYRIFGADGVQMGGMMTKPEAMPASAWRFYVNVDGIDSAAERVKANGGQVTMGPHEVPGGSWIVQCVDPQGANFALVSTRR